ncbi:unnamed protein product, partial [marine sediment metagenome]
IVIYGDFDISSTNYVKVAMDKIDPTYTIGKRFDIDDQLDWSARLSVYSVTLFRILSTQ